MGTIGAKERLMELFAESVIVQSLITLILLVTICVWYMVPLLRGQEVVEVPNLLAALAGTAVGYWYKAKSELQLRRTVRELQR